MLCLSAQAHAEAIPSSTPEGSEKPWDTSHHMQYRHACPLKSSSLQRAALIRCDQNCMLSAGESETMERGRRCAQLLGTQPLTSRCHHTSGLQQEHNSLLHTFISMCAMCWRLGLQETKQIDHPFKDSMQGRVRVEMTQATQTSMSQPPVLIEVNFNQMLQVWSVLSIEEYSNIPWLSQRRPPQL